MHFLTQLCFPGYSAHCRIQAYTLEGNMIGAFFIIIYKNRILIKPENLEVSEQKHFFFKVRAPKH